MLEEGFGSVVLETPGGIVFRVARTARAAAGHAREAALLPSLRRRVPVDIPVPEWQVEPGHPQLPFGALGYRKLPGRHPAPEDVLDGPIAWFLRALHRMTIDIEIPRRPSWREQVLELQDLLPIVAERLERNERRALEAWCRGAAEDERLARREDALVHGDAWYGNMLVDGTPPRLVAVLDWSNAALGDPAEDLAAQFYFGEDAGDAVLDAYPADDDLRLRVTHHRVLREFGGIRWSIEQHDQAELAESIEKLRRTPIFTA